MFCKTKNTEMSILIETVVAMIVW